MKKVYEIKPQFIFSYAEGHAWCVEITKQSVYASLAMELELNKAIDLLRQGQLETASQVNIRWILLVTLLWRLSENTCLSQLCYPLATLFLMLITFDFH